MATLYDYIAAKAPNDAFALLRTYDTQVQRPNSADEMAEMLKSFVNQGGEPALRALAQIHPDRDLLIDRPEYANADGAQQNYSCACGCKHQGYNFYGANGFPPAPASPAPAQGGALAGTQDNLVLLIGGAMLLLVVSAVIKRLE